MFKKDEELMYHVDGDLVKIVSTMPSHKLVRVEFLSGVNKSEKKWMPSKRLQVYRNKVT